MKDSEVTRPLDRLVLTAAAQRAVDEEAVARGVPHADLMESAGRSAAEWTFEHLNPTRVAVLAGPGGNGGDALVVARLLIERGVDTRTFLLSLPDRMTETARTMLERLEAVGGRPIPVEGGPCETVERALAWADCAVDGLLGSGATRPLEGRYLDVVKLLNGADVRVVSLDLPSGLASDAGRLLGEAVRADVTLAMAFLKPAHLLFPASERCGNVAVVDVAYPPALLEGVEPLARVPERAGIARWLPARRPDGHKGTFGRVLVVAGSVGMTGAAILCCRGALRAGAGLVTLAAPGSLDGILEAALPEVITIPLPDEGGRLRNVDDARFAAAFERADVLAIGPGLSRASGTAAAVRDLVAAFDGPIVLDADGIVAFAGHVDRLKDARRLLLTPHPGELGSLVGRSPEDVDADRITEARVFAVEHDVALLLKGRPSAIGLPNGRVWLNPTGNAGLATGGSGDVLTGLIAGFVAGGASLENAAILGAYVHGWAAEVFVRDRAERSLLPSDLIDLLPMVLREVETWR